VLDDNKINESDILSYTSNKTQKVHFIQVNLEKWRESCNEDIKDQFYEILCEKFEIVSLIKSLENLKIIIGNVEPKEIDLKQISIKMQKQLNDCLVYLNDCYKCIPTLVELNEIAKNIQPIDMYDNFILKLNGFYYKWLALDKVNLENKIDIKLLMLFLSSNQVLLKILKVKNNKIYFTLELWSDSPQDLNNLQHAVCGILKVKNEISGKLKIIPVKFIEKWPVFNFLGGNLSPNKEINFSFNQISCGVKLNEKFKILSQKHISLLERHGWIIDKKTDHYLISTNDAQFLIIPKIQKFKSQDNLTIKNLEGLNIIISIT
jgi:hypothetical protein